MKIYPTFVNMEFDFVFISIVTVGFISIRLWIASWDYSGYNKPPIYGDFEAQRHWMEITTSLNIGDWYKFSKLNDLNYWGLDYPPLTAYISWFYGKIAQILFPDLVQFEISRGHQSPFGKLFMRISVLFSDIVILFPSVLLLTNALYYRKSLSLNISNYTKVILLLIFLCCPSLLLIDHGHFQYNGVCIGLTLLAVYAISINRDVLGSILFCLALNFKQMTLYYSPVFFCHLLYKCSRKSSFYSKIIHFLKIGLSVIVTFTILWKPFCLFHHKDETCGSSLLLVLRRIFPFSRGIFEDKVSNIWYGLSVIFDYRDYVTNPQELVPYSVLLTLLLISPIMIDLLLHDADINRFLIALSNSSLGFFLASFQVHEKSLLLSLVPAIIILPNNVTAIGWYQILGCFTMFPLLIRDGLRAPYFIINVLFIIALIIVKREIQDFVHAPISLRFKFPSLFSSTYFEFLMKIFIMMSSLGMVLLHSLEMTVQPPKRYPDLYPALFSLYGLCNLLVIYCIGIVTQLSTESFNLNEHQFVQIKKIE